MSPKLKSVGNLLCQYLFVTFAVRYLIVKCVDKASNHTAFDVAAVVAHSYPI